MWLAASSCLKTPVDRAVNLKMRLLGSIATSPDDIVIGSVSVDIACDFVTGVTDWESGINDEQQIGKPAFVAVMIYQWLKFFPLGLDLSNKLSFRALAVNVGAFHYSVLFKEPTHMLWTYPYNGNGHA